MSYRSPEQLLLSPVQTTAVDIWALGCILTELCTLEILFPGDGNSELAQISLIFDTFGPPTVQEWQALGCRGLQPLVRADPGRGSALEVMVPEARALATCMLKYPPVQRLTAGALKSRAFFGKSSASEQLRGTFSPDPQHPEGGGRRGQDTRQDT